MPAKTISIALSVLLLTAATADARLTVRIPDYLIYPGTSGFAMEAYISSDTGADVINSYNLVLDITTGAGNVGQIVYSGTQTPDASGDPNYIFSGDSFGIATNPNLDNPGNPGGNDRLITGDFTLSGTDVTVPANERLLARFYVDHSFTGDIDAAMWETWTVSVNQEPVGGSFFTDSAFNIITDFDVTNGSITSAPEPGSLGLGVLAAAAFAGVWYRRRRKQRREAAEATPETPVES
jgi:MYXO-CTERM domain-containing protein